MFDISPENSQMAKQFYLIAYNAVGFFMAVYILIQLAPETLGITDPIVNGYVKKNSAVRCFYQLSEAMVMIEVFNHVFGI